MTIGHSRFAPVSLALAALVSFTWNSAAQTRGGAPPRPTTGSGPYKAVMEMDAGLPDHTIYRPEDMSSLNGATLPIPVFRAWERGVGHGGTYNQPNGGEFAGVGVAWLNWQLRGDQKAALMFRGPDCGLCVNPKWVVQTKNFK